MENKIRIMTEKTNVVKHLVFCVVLLCVFTFRVVMSVTISVYKLCSVRLYLQLFVGGLMS
jgi:hypothetical protein